ncbi:MAG TPA: low affinity iron permease family protein [Pyrinomonadaceae bacterium]|jgi:low affinity Fe/Cu permease|nr:low affinity iron permease family protein [Pyrinomonadaceae bacterium]
MPRKRSKVGEFLEKFSYQATRATGTSAAFVLAVLIIVIWVITGPLFHYSDTWQLVINTGTTIVTFLMVFLIQRAQNKDALALHLKLNEIVAALEGASNRLIDVEDLSEPEINALRSYYKRLIELARKDDVLTTTHSIEEAATRHGTKYKKKATDKTDKRKSDQR